MKRRVRGFVDRLIPMLTGGGDGGGDEQDRHHGLESYLFDIATEQRIVADFREGRPGEKHFHWEQRGVPFRIEIGPRDVDQESFVLKGRIDGSKEIVKLADVSAGWLKEKLDRASCRTLRESPRFPRSQHTRCGDV